MRPICSKEDDTVNLWFKGSGESHKYGTYFNLLATPHLATGVASAVIMRLHTSAPFLSLNEFYTEIREVVSPISWVFIHIQIVKKINGVSNESRNHS